MSEQDPKRLREGGGGGELRSLLEAGRSEVPTDGQMVMLAAKIGIIGGLGGAGAAGAAGAGGAGAGAGGAAGAGAVGGKAAVAAGAVKVGLAVKVIGAVAIVGAAGTGAAVVVSARHVETAAPVGLVATAAPKASAGAKPSASANANANANAQAEANTDADAAPELATARSASTAARNTPRVASAEPKDEGPEAEVKLVERAQKARQGSPAEALALCNDHARRFPNGMLAQECEIIAIEALVKTGRKDEARTRANRFKSRFPGSSGIRRLDVLLGD